MLNIKASKTPTRNNFHNDQPFKEIKCFVNSKSPNEIS